MSDRVCPACNGTGYGPHGELCGTCRGRRFLPIAELSRLDTEVEVEQRCRVKGTGGGGDCDLLLMSDGTVRWRT